MSNSPIQVFPATARSSTVTSSNFDNSLSLAWKGVVVAINVTSAPGVAIITPIIQGYNTATNTYYNILVGPQISGIGATVLRVYPGISNSSTSANEVLPATWRVIVEHLTAATFTYSVGADLID